MRIITTYNNWTDETIRFEFRGSDEMQFVFYLYYTGASATVVLEEHTAVVPQDFALARNYPNPFNGSTVIGFALPSSEEVGLAVYNLAGQKVATLVQGARQAGAYILYWDGRDEQGRDLASGVYLYRLRAGARAETRRLLLLR